MKFIFLKIFIIATLLLNLNCLAEISPDLQQIISRGKLIIAIPNKDYPPFFFHNKKKKFVGFDIEMAANIAKALGVSLEINTDSFSFNDVIAQVEEDKADLGLGNLSASVSRGLRVNFSQPYLIENRALIINRVLDIQRETNINYLSKDRFKIAVVQNSSYESFIQDKLYLLSQYGPISTIISYDSIDSAMDDLMHEKLYGIFIEEIKANYLLKNKPSANIFAKKYLLNGQLDAISIAVNYKKPNLLNWINLYIQETKYNGYAQKLYQKYFEVLK